MSRIRTGITAGEWRDEGPAAPYSPETYRGALVVAVVERTGGSGCGKVMVKGGRCGRSSSTHGGHCVTAATITSAAGAARMRRRAARA